MHLLEKTANAKLSPTGSYATISGFRGRDKGDSAAPCGLIPLGIESRPDKP
jgi:hypothetical protein